MYQFELVNCPFIVPPNSIEFLLRFYFLSNHSLSFFRIQIVIALLIFNYSYDTLQLDSTTLPLELYIENDSPSFLLQF